MYVPSICPPLFHWRSTMIQWSNVFAILYGIIVCLIKLSILLQFQRIFVPNRRSNMPLFVVIQLIMWTTFVFYFFETIFAIAMCNPREKIWNLLMTTGHCLNLSAIYMASGIFNVISDFSIFILPMVPIWKLQLPLKKKILAFATFATGLWYVLFVFKGRTDSAPLEPGCRSVQPC